MAHPAGDLQTVQARFTLGVPELLDGIDVVVVAVGSGLPEASAFEMLTR